MVTERIETAATGQTIMDADRARRSARISEAARLYATYGRPLEAEHWGKFLAVSPGGRTVLGDDLERVSNEAAETIGHGSFLFKIGEMAVGAIR